MADTMADWMAESLQHLKTITHPYNPLKPPNSKSIRPYRIPLKTLKSHLYGMTEGGVDGKVANNMLRRMKDMMAGWHA